MTDFKHKHKPGDLLVLRSKPLNNYIPRGELMLVLGTQMGFSHHDGTRSQPVYIIYKFNDTSTR
jgi:hypothetical protein